MANKVMKKKAVKLPKTQKEKKFSKEQKELK